MLRVIGKNVRATGQVEVDYYIPLGFMSPTLLLELPIIFHTGDQKRQLFEIKVNRRTGVSVRNDHVASAAFWGKLTYAR